MSIFMQTILSQPSLKKATVFTVAALSLVSISSVQAQTAQGTRRHSSLLKMSGYAPSELLVTFKGNPLSQTAKDVNAKVGATTKRTFSFINTQQVKVPAGVSLSAAAQKYMADPNVANVQPNYRYQGLATPTVTPNDPRFGEQYGLSIINAPAAWYYVTGNTSSTASATPTPTPPEFKNPRDLIRWRRNNRQEQTPQRKDVVIAVIDTGVALNHLDIRNNLWRNTQEIAGNGRDDDDNGYIDDIFGIDAANNDTNPNDDEGHGTHVAGIIGAIGNNAFGVTGVNWRTKIMALKFLSATNTGDTAGAITCMQYMIRMKNRGVNVRVANHSWGPQIAPETGIPFDAALQEAFQDAADDGIINVIAAGNGDEENGQGVDNDQFATYPANLQVPNKLVVAASDQNDNPAVFRNDTNEQIGATNFGQDTVDLAAPGLNILSTYPFIEVSRTETTVTEVPSNTAFMRLSGTSMAAPHVAGAAGLLFAFSPELTAGEVRQSILDGVDVLPQWFGLVHSNGRLNLYKALLQSFQYRDDFDPGNPDVTPTPLPTPTPFPTPTPDPNATPTPTPTATPTPQPTPLTNGNIVFMEENSGFFPTISQISATGTNQAVLISDIRLFQDPYISQRTGKVAYTVDLANVNQNFESVVTTYGFARTYSFPSNEIFVRTTTGDFRITNDEANGVAPVDDREPAISPDGTRIAFVKRDVSGNDDLYITSAIPDYTRPGGAPVQYRLDIDDASGISLDSNPSWDPTGTRLVFQSNRGAGGDYDIYVITVPENYAGEDLPAPTQLTNNPGDDIEPTIGTVRDESRIARPDGQLVYASSRDDGADTGLGVDDPTFISFYGREDYDIYLQNVSLENVPLPTNSSVINRAQRIVDSPARAVEVLVGTGDTNPFVPTRIQDDNPTTADDEYGVSVSFSGDDRHPHISADGGFVIFSSDSNFYRPDIPLGTPVAARNPNDDFDICRIDINGRNFTRLTDDLPTRTRINRTGTYDIGLLAYSEDYEPVAGAVVAPTPTTGTASASSSNKSFFPSTPFKRP